MKVRFVATKDTPTDTWLSDGAIYTVLEVHIDKEHGIMYRLSTEGEPNIPALHPASRFRQVSGYIPSTWSIDIVPDHDGKATLTLAPHSWLFDFWDRFFDGDLGAIRTFEEERELIVSDELNSRKNL